MNLISEEVTQSVAIFPPGTGNKMAVFSAVGYIGVMAFYNETVACNQ